MKKTLMKGNHAVAEAAIRAGVRLFAGYPITPSTEILEYMSEHLPKAGGIFLQCENEIASAHVVGGAYCTGQRAMTATSAGGFTLMQEFGSYAADAGLPFVIVNVVRSGRGIGSLDPGQDGYRQACYGGGGGDYRQIVYNPNSIQEMVDDMYEAFDVAEKYRIGVIILTESSMGQMMEAVRLPEPKKQEQLPAWASVGRHKWDRDAGQWEWKRKEYAGKMAAIEAEMQRFETFGVEDAEYVFVSSGLPSRAVEGAVKKLVAEGHKVGYIRPKLVFPFPEKAFRMVNPNVKGFINVETTEIGQMVSDTAVTVKKVFQDRNVPVYMYPYGIGIPSMKEILNKYYEVTGGLCKEVY